MSRTLTTLCISIIFFSCTSDRPLSTVNQVDPERYAGRWYEIASFPIRPQRHCTCTYAEYSIQSPNTIGVYNHCLDSTDGEVKDIHGKAFAEDSSFSRLQVQFFWPFKSPYYIIDLDTLNYQYALVGNPSRENLWILSRAPYLGKDTISQLLSKAAAMDFDTTELNWTIHRNCNK